MRVVVEPHPDDVGRERPKTVYFCDRCGVIIAYNAYMLAAFEVSDLHFHEPNCPAEYLTTRPEPTTHPGVPQ